MIEFGMIKYIVALAVLLLSQCSAAYGAECGVPAVDESHTTLVVYRPHNQYGMLIGTDVYIDNVRVCRLSNGRFIVAPVSPGQHQLRVGSEKNVPVDLKLGSAYYFRIGVSVSLCCKPQSAFHLQAATAQGASVELVNTEPQVNEMKLPVLIAPDIGAPVQ